MYIYALNNPLSNFDINGLYATEGCSNKDRKKVDDAVEKAKKASKCLDCDDDTKNNSKEFEEALNNVTFQCTNKTILPNPKYITCGVNREPAGTKSPTPHKIMLPKELFNGKCGCIEATIFHEVLHSYPFQYHEKKAFKKEKECLSCAKVPSDEDFDKMY